jgi:hypothetical protein
MKKVLIVSAILMTLDVAGAALAADLQPADTVATPALVMIDDPLWWTTALKTARKVLRRALSSSPWSNCGPPK